MQTRHLVIATAFVASLGLGACYVEIKYLCLGDITR